MRCTLRGEQIAIRRIVRCVEKSLLPTVSTLRNVVRNAGNNISRQTCHDAVVIDLTMIGKLVHCHSNSVRLFQELRQNRIIWKRIRMIAEVSSNNHRSQLLARVARGRPSAILFATRAVLTSDMTMEAKSERQIASIAVMEASAIIYLSEQNNGAIRFATGRCSRWWGS